MPRIDAAVVGSGPNGLAAAITLAEAGLSVHVLEARPTPGGGCRSDQLTLPGYTHDVCATVQALTCASPFFRRLDLPSLGLDLVHPEVPLAHPFDDGTAAALMRSLDETAEGLGEGGSGYRRLLAPLVADADALMRDVLAPAGVPEHPVTFTRFGMRAALPASLLAHTLLRGGAARALFGGLAAHSMLPLNSLFTSAFALMLAAGGHAYGWPVARGGSQRVTDGLVARLRALGGEIRCDSEVRTLGDVPDARVVLFDVTPRQLLDICGDSLPAPYRSRLGRFRYGVGVFKLDWALSDPIPWRAPVCRRAGTVHLGGTLEELAASESAPARGRVAERPFVLLVQPTVCDPSRAPDGRHVGWAYCHVPNGYTGDLTSVIEGQVERFAPGFRDTILARHVLTPAGLQSHNANYIGGDINGGAQDALQLFTRPVARLDPYSTPNPRLFICSSSTPPGGGVHGMCGHHAARSALKRLGVRPPGQ